MKLTLYNVEGGYVYFTDDAKDKRQKRTINDDMTFMYRNHMWIVSGTIYEVERDHKKALHFVELIDSKVYFRVGINETIQNRIICKDGHFNHKGVRYQVIREIICKEEI